ncbi:MAG: phosphonatase-like hydrolase [Armatimonadota bacterium]
MRNIELAIFDMAGTTVVDRRNVLQAYMEALQTHGIRAPEQELHRHRGRSKRATIAALVQAHAPDGGDELVDAAYATFQQALERSYEQGNEPIPGTLETFAWLRERGIKIALNTGFYRRVMRTMLENLGWDEAVVDCAICADDVPAGRPAPDMIFAAMSAVGVSDVSRVVAVGDTVLDLQAAMRAGVAGAVGVLSGSHDAVSLGATRHTHIIPSVAELPELLGREF